jgi:hypothetical protein
MLTSVSLFGRMGEVISEKEGLRYVEVDRIVPNSDGAGVYETDKFVVYSPFSTSFFIHAPKGNLISLNGRIENRQPYGLIIVDEIDEIIALPEKMEKRMSKDGRPVTRQSQNL